MKMDSQQGALGASPKFSAADGLKSLDIRTKTIELTLQPMLQQITSLVNKRVDNLTPTHNGGHLPPDVDEVSQSLQGSVSSFISAGEKVGQEYPAIQQAMLVACKQASEATMQIIERANEYNNGKELISPIRQLLTTMYKVLVLADSVIVKEIIQAKDKVVSKLDFLTKVANFTDFLNNFTSFGSEMAEFGKLTGERQLDMKKELDAAKMACLRGFLEKSTAIYLTCCKICLRHPTNSLSRETRDTIVGLMKKGLEEIVEIVCYSATANTDDHEKILSRSLADYLDSLEMCVILSGDTTSVGKAKQCFTAVDEYVNDFTDSPYTPHEHRELIILTCQKCQEEVNQLVEMSNHSSEMIEMGIENCQVSAQNLRRQLIQHTIASAAELFGSSVDTGLLAGLKTAAQEGDTEMVENISSQIRDHADQIQEMSRQMQHVSPTDSFYIRVKYTASYLLTLTELLLQSAEVFCCHGMSKAAVEGYSTMADSWVMLIGELAAAAEELQESLYLR